MNSIARTKFSRALASLGLAALFIAPTVSAQQAPANTGAKSGSATDASDPVLKAMHEELERSKAKLKMDNVPAPYYIEYRLSDVDEFDAEAAFGSVRQNQASHVRSIHVVVRVGDYKQDSYYGRGMGSAELAPLDNDVVALRRQLWLATDQAYKMASEALAQKKAVMSEFSGGQPFDDFAHASPLELVEPLAKLSYDPKPYVAMIEKATGLYRNDPKLDMLSAHASFRAVNQYFENTEGTVTRHGYAVYELVVAGSTQADDGMKLDRSPYYITGSAAELPSAEKFQADSEKMVATLKALREAPIVEEDYRGPVLFSSDAASDIVYSMIGRNLLGERPKPGDSARTLGDFASNYKSRVLPTFLSVVDDPTMKTFQGQTLIGSYDADDEGVRPSKVSLIQDGVLENYLLGRQPIRDFPDSNGHGRAAPGQPTMPTIGNLIVQSKTELSPADLKKKLIDLCRQDGKAFGYYVETMANDDPRLLYRVYEKDGHEELVRGAVFDELDTRTLRNDLIGVGSDPLVSNREGFVPSTVIAPSLLLDELEVKRTDAKNAKLHEYPPPDLTKK